MRLFRYSFINHSCVSLLVKVSQRLATEKPSNPVSLFRTLLKFEYSWASLVAQMLKNPPAVQDTWVRPLG